MIETAVLGNWIGAILGAIATVIATHQLKGRSDMKAQLQANTLEITRLKANQQSDRELLSQKMTSIEVELRDMKESVKDDVKEMKDSVGLLTKEMSTVGELRGMMTTIINGK